MYTNGYDRYLETAVETASPARLIVMLYDGAIRFINNAIDAMQNRQYEQQNYYLQRAQKILAELISSLDFDKGGEIAENLFRLYTYMYNQLVEANLQDSVERAQHVVNLLSELREAWDTIASQGEAVPATPIAPGKVSLRG
ncbi:MAG: flagellar export chaperone FliS [Fimbriimonadales bacterium]|jgi:flagellar protein FliS|nr:flagellar export chaperone FliS [Armatimonadota bacterium]MCX7688381.1 flagellar export chaperone FliS [Fimbriimonadales bacterium]CUU10429.1 flagellar protein FliS [Armatimonadetes bacterium GBS]CUU34623.1 flagellar protein FliS [Armatimonadetes bacterium DC]CUU37904.1 flagellar protein FliS [Armatimonadetes bacterium GXS]GBC91152.1 Flagellar protein FliS [bacterium HR14]